MKRSPSLSLRLLGRPISNEFWNDIVDVVVAVCGVAHVGATGDKLDNADVAASRGLAHGDGSGERGDAFE